MQLKQLVVLLGFAMLLCSSVSSMATGKDEVSPATKQQMQLISNSIDNKVEPCDDFYAYACDNWENQPIARGYNSSNHVIIQNNFLQKLGHMLDTEYPNQEHVKKTKQSFKDKVLAFYYSCKNVKDYEYFELIKPGSAIEWPLVDEFNGKPENYIENFNLFTFLGHLFGYGFNNFLLKHSERRKSNGKLYIVLETANEEYLDLSYIKYMLRSVGYGNDKQKMSNYSREIKETHNKWLATYKEYDAFTGGEYSYLSLKNEYPEVAYFLNLMFPNQLKEDDIVKIDDIKYIKFLTTKQWQPQEIRKLHNYAMALLSKYLRNQYSGDCVQQVLSKMHLGVNYMYRQHYYTAEMKAAFTDLKDKIYKYLLELVNENYLQLNPEHLKAVKEKLARAYVSVGNVPDITDDAMVEEFYRHLPDLDINNYSQNVVWSLKQRLWERVNCPENMECIDEIGHGVYNTEFDVVIIALASMGPPMYDWTFDPIFAVSLMGVFIGHEYAHSIDTDALRDFKVFEAMSREFQKQPNINAAIECTNQQYETDYLRQLEVDLVGARAAFRAYNNEYKMQPSFTKIPWQQLFFLNFAQFFCEWKDWSGSLTEQTARTNHVAMNMDEFAEAFKCPAGSKMNPVKKCLLY